MSPVRDLRLPSEGDLREFVVNQRWFGSKSKEVAHFRLLETIPLSEQPLILAVLEVEFLPGTHELYQLPMGARPEGEWTDGVICANDGMAIYDAMTDPEMVKTLVGLIASGTEIETAQGVAEFRALGELGEIHEVRPMGAEQSNSSVVLDERLVLKAYRRLGAGPNPELEILRFLTEREFPHIAALRGWVGHHGRLIDATLGIVQEFLPGATDGWDLALADLREDPARFIARARELGAVTGRLHAVLGSETQDPAFAAEDTSVESLGMVTATVEEEIDQVFMDLPADNPALEPIRGRGEEVRDRLRHLTHAGSAGRIIRHHGDYHLGQVVRTSDGDWVVLDFEGEPARTLVERRRKRSPLRDVAGMLRSFAYAATAAELLHGAQVPAHWELDVRAAFLDGYLEETDQSLLPPGRAGVERLLAVFELEKAVYELRYELDNRPDWVKIPVAGIVRLLAPADEDAE